MKKEESTNMAQLTINIPPSLENRVRGLVSRRYDYEGRKNPNEALDAFMQRMLVGLFIDALVQQEASEAQNGVYDAAKTKAKNEIVLS